MRANVLSVGARRWRLVVWGAAALLFLLPGVAMQFTDEVQWNRYDFAVFAAMLGGACAAYELLARGHPNHLYRAGIGAALLGAFMLVWINGAVGIIGREDNPANLLFGLVLLIGAAGAALARLRARGLACTLLAMAVAQTALFVAALAAGWPHSNLAAAFFVALWLAAALLFWRAAQPG